MRPDNKLSTRYPAGRARRIRTVAVIALLFAIAAGGAFAFLRQRPSAAAGHAMKSPMSGHDMGMHGRHGAFSGGPPPSTPPALSPAEARERALKDLKESRDQIERMKAQGAGWAAADASR